VTAQDVRVVATGLARATGRPVEPSLVRAAWLLGAHPAGFAGVLATDARGAAIGHVGASPVPLRIDGRERRGGRLAISFVDPLHRVGGTHGLGPALVREFLATSGFDLVFGWLDEADWWALRVHHGFVAVGTSVELARPAGPLAGPEPAARAVPADEAALERWESPLVGGGDGTRRDGRLVAFRLGGPWTGDLAWLVRRGDDVVACAVARENGGRRLLLDWAVESGDVDAASALLRAVTGGGRCAVTAPRWTSSEWTTWLGLQGFRVRAGDERVLAARLIAPGLDAQKLRESWPVLAADAGVAPIARLLADEDVVTPPPPGTETGRGPHRWE
jgi:hypothetical protein